MEIVLYNSTKGWLIQNVNKLLNNEGYRNYGFVMI